MKLPVKFRRSTLLTKVVILLVVVSATVILVSQRAQIRENEARVQALTEQAAALRQENQELQSDIDGLDSDESVRKIAQDELGLVSSGSVIFSDAGE